MNVADEDQWLEALARNWSGRYLLSVSDARWIAIRRDGSGNALIRDTPGDLAAAMRTDTTAGAR